MASGLPAVVSDKGGPPELIRQGETGFITRGLDVDDFTRALQRIVEDGELRRTMSGNAVRAVQDRDWGVAVQQFWDSSPE